MNIVSLVTTETSTTTGQPVNRVWSLYRTIDGGYAIRTPWSSTALYDSFDIALSEWCELARSVHAS